MYLNLFKLRSFQLSSAMYFYYLIETMTQQLCAATGIRIYENLIILTLTSGFSITNTISRPWSHSLFRTDHCFAYTGNQCRPTVSLIAVWTLIYEMHIPSVHIHNDQPAEVQWQRSLILSHFILISVVCRRDLALISIGHFFPAANVPGIREGNN